MLRDPDQFLSALSGDTITKKDLIELRVALSSRPVVWIDKFCTHNGITLLLQTAVRTAGPPPVRHTLVFLT